MWIIKFESVYLHGPTINIYIELFKCLIVTKFLDHLVDLIKPLLGACKLRFMENLLIILIAGETMRQACLVAQLNWKVDPPEKSVYHNQWLLFIS